MKVIDSAAGHRSSIKIINLILVDILLLSLLLFLLLVGLGNTYLISSVSSVKFCGTNAVLAAAEMDPGTFYKQQKDSDCWERNDIMIE